MGTSAFLVQANRFSADFRSLTIGFHLFNKSQTALGRTGVPEDIGALGKIARDRN